MKDVRMLFGCTKNIMRKDMTIKMASTQNISVMGEKVLRVFRKNYYL